VQHLHDEMRLAIGEAAGHVGADAWRDGRVEGVEVEAHVQHAVAGRDPLQDTAHEHARAVLVDEAHVHHVDAARHQEVALVAVDGADAEEMQVRGIDEAAGLAAEHLLQSLLAAQQRRRHAVHVPRRGAGGGVEVGMRVEPQDEELAPGLRRMARHAVHGAHGEAVIAA
jgi:hypothetical protein